MQHQSQLLQAVDQLDGSAWAETLLPLLKKNKSSAKSFALTCKRLRQLCHGSQRSLKLSTSNCAHMLAQPACNADVLQQSFPACSDVKFTATKASDLSMTWIVSLRMLARLPDLNTLWLEVQDKTVTNLVHLPPALELMHLQLPKLQTLKISIRSSWPSPNESHVEQACWRILGDLTNLTNLTVTVKDKDCCGFHMQHLTGLSPLSSSLQALCLKNVYNPGWLSQRAEDYAFISCLTALTGLDMPVAPTRRQLTSISHCTALRDLQLRGPLPGEGSNPPHVSAEECTALQQLTCLTRLYLPDTHAPRTAQEAEGLCSTLQSLQTLQMLAAYAMDLRILPALASLTSLTHLSGTWRGGQQQDEPSQQGNVRCSSVKVLDLASPASRPVPYQLFPNVRLVRVHQSFQPEQLLTILPNCWQHLTSLTLPSRDSGGHVVNITHFFSLNPEASLSQRTAVIRCLADLSQLCHLQFVANHDAEVVAVASMTQLKQLTLCVPQGSKVTSIGLASLARLSLLQSLTYQIESKLFLEDDEVSTLLPAVCALQGVNKVTFRVSARQQAVLISASAACHAAGLRPPAHLWCLAL